MHYFRFFSITALIENYCHVRNLNKSFRNKETIKLIMIDITHTGILITFSLAVCMCMCVYACACGVGGFVCVCCLWVYV